MAFVENKSFSCPHVEVARASLSFDVLGSLVDTMDLPLFQESFARSAQPLKYAVVLSTVSSILSGKLFSAECLELVWEPFDKSNEDCLKETYCYLEREALDFAFRDM